MHSADRAFELRCAQTIYAGELDTIRDWGGKERYHVQILSVGKTVEGG